MARVTTVQRARKSPGTCGWCGTAIEAGQPYRWTQPGFRGRKLVRCAKPECQFRQSHLTTGGRRVNITFFLQTNKVGSRVSTDVEVDAEEWAELTEPERDQYLLEMFLDIALARMGEWGWSINPEESQ